MVRLCDQLADEYSLSPVSKVFLTEVSGKVCPI